MAGPFDAYPLAPAGTPGAAPPAPAPAAPGATQGPFDAYPLAPQQPSQQAAPREASGPLQAIQAGYQSSATGLALRGRLADVVLNPEHSAWWERALSGIAQVGSELPIMIPAGAAGTAAGAAAGGGIGGPPGAAIGGVLGGGAGMFAVPTAIRETLMQAYRSGEIKTGADFWNAVREVATHTVRDAAIGAATLGAGGMAARTVGKAIAPAIGETLSVPAATRIIGSVDTAAQIATMTSMPAALQGHLPDWQEFMDGAIIVGALHVAGIPATKIANRMANVFAKTGKTPAEQVADAQADPNVAKDLSAGPGEPEAGAAYTPPKREDMLTIQESLFRETARLNEVEAKANGTTDQTIPGPDGQPITIPGRPKEFLTEAERQELPTLRARVAELEAQLRAGPDAAAPIPASYSAETLADARRQADNRLAALKDKADTSALTDAERAERVFLSNAGGKPEALARHFGLEPNKPAVITAEAFDASAQRVYDDVHRQLMEADRTREAAGQQPLGKDHANDIATLVRARANARARRNGVLPEEIYRDRAYQIRADSQEPKAPEVAPAGPPQAPQEPPAGQEVDLFGNPIEAPATAPQHAVVEKPVVSIPLDKLVLSKEVPQFKGGANAEGVVHPLGGSFDPTGVGPIQVWERADGTLEVISGRHRFDLAKRSGRAEINAQVHREADGFTRDQAASLDAILNIRDEQGSVADYAQYFKTANIDKAAADAAGLLGREKGRAGFAIARDASPDLLAAHRAGKLSDQAAVSISSAAPGSERLQALGIAAVNDGKSILFAVNTMRAVELMAAERMAAGTQGDIFGFDDSAMVQAAAMAKKASSKQRQLGEQIAAVQGASKRPELARKLGVDVQDPAGIQAKIVELKNEQYLWDNWPLYPELVAKLRGETLKQDEVPMAPETPAEGEARDAEATAAAKRQNSGITPAVLFQSLRDTWYRSALGEAVNLANIKSAAAKGWQDFLKGQVAKGGVKADEIKWSGIEEWLQLQSGKVTKEQVADYLAQHGVRVEEVMLGDGERGGFDVIQRAFQAEGYRVERDPIAEEAGVFYEDPTGEPIEFADLPARLQAVVNANADHFGNEPAGATKFGQYVLHGGQNYRELLLKLPPEPPAANKVTVEEVGRFQETPVFRVTVNGVSADVHHNPGYPWKADLPGGQSIGDMPDQATAIASTKEWLELRHGNRQPPASFTSSHFPDTTNPLAHIRFNERTDADGKRVLFIEEFQSDWAQKGKKEGFTKEVPEQGPPMDFTIVQTEHQYIVTDPVTGMNVDIGKGTVDSESEARAYADNYFTGKLKERHQRNIGTVPTAPFVGKTDAWLALSMKRMIAYAAQHGYERIAWTTGAQQVERYTSALRHAVDSIEWEKTKDGIHLKGFKGDERPVVIDAAIRRRAVEALGRHDLLGFDSANEALHAIEAHADWLDRWDVSDMTPGDRNAVDAYLGDVSQAREAAKNVRREVVNTHQQENELSDAIGKAMAEKIISDPNQKGTIEGDALRIDDTGMAGFYDRIAPSVAKEVLRKLDKEVKVGAVKFGGKLELPAEYDVFKEDDGSYTLVGPDGYRETGFESRYDATEGAWEAKGEQPQSLGDQQGFDITPKMREESSRGLPLFQGQSENRGSYDVAQNLITIMAGADKSTVVHELGHSWLEEMKADAGREDAPEQIRTDWDTLRKELAIGADGAISVASHEQFARSVERYLADGEAPSAALQGVFERFKQWLLDIYKDLRGLNVTINPDLRQVLDRMLATDDEIAAARRLDVPREYVPAAEAAAAEKMVPTPGPQATAARRRIVPGFVAEQHSMQPFADEIPRGPGEAPDTSRINLQYVNGPEDLKLAMARMAELDQAEIQRQRGGTEGVKSWAEANAEQAAYLNGILGGSPDTLHLFEPRDPNAPQIDARLGALKKFAVAAAKDSARLRDVVLEAGHDATVRQQLEYMGSIERARMIQAEFLGERASVARALNALKDVTEGTGEIGRMLEAIGTGAQTLFQAARTAAEEQAYMKAKLDEIMQNYKGKTVLDLAKLHKEIGTLKGSFKFAEEVTKATKWDMVVEGWRSGLLSGPVTHTTNFFGTASFLFMRPAVDALAAVIGMARGASPGMGESDRATMSMAVARLTGMIGGVQEGLVVGYHTFRADDPTGKTESYRTAIPGPWGEFIRIPLRLMGASDAVMQTMYGRGELAVQAMLQAFNKGENPGTREFATTVDTLKDQPTPEMQVAADSASKRMAFNSPPGEKTLALMGFVNKWKLQWVIPFINTPINIFQESLRLSPFAPAVTEWRQAIAKGGIERDRALAEMALGTGIMALTVAYAFGGQITGSTGPDPGKNRAKAGVEQPGSVLIGDTWHEYTRIQPIGTLMNFAADMAAVWDHMNDEEKDKIPKMLANAFAQAVTNQTFLQGITNVVNAMSDPTRFGPRFVQQLAGSAVPNIIAQPTAMADPVNRQINSALEAVMARIPGFRQELEVKRDWLGEPDEARARLGVVLPSRTLQVSDDKVRLEAARLDISVAAPPKKMHLGKGTGKIGDVELTPQEQSKFAEVGGKMAHEILANVVGAPGYDQIPDLIKRRIFSNVLTASHRVAAVQALPMDKRLAYLQQITEKFTQELQPGDSP